MEARSGRRKPNNLVRRVHAGHFLPPSKRRLGGCGQVFHRTSWFATLFPSIPFQTTCPATPRANWRTHLRTAVDTGLIPAAARGTHTHTWLLLLAPRQTAPGCAKLGTGTGLKGVTTGVRSRGRGSPALGWGEAVRAGPSVFRAAAMMGAQFGGLVR